MCAMEDLSDTESTQLLGHWDFLLPPEKGTGVSDKEGGGSRSTIVGGRVLPPWADPSYEWGGGKWKLDGRKTRKKYKKEKKKESDLSLKDLIDEYSSLPPQIAEWYWCIEYVAKFVKDLRCILDLMNMAYPPTNDYGSRINEVLALRILEFLFDPTKYDPTTFIGPRIEFDLSLSNTHVLNAILRHIPVSELRPGMPELSTFNVVPFIAHKNMSLPQCALEKLRDLSAMENQTSAAIKANDTVCRNDPPEHRDVCEEMQTNEGIVIDGNDKTAEQPINTTTRETVSPSCLGVCVKDGVWLICGSSDDELDMVKGPGLVPPQEENVCWKCEREGGGLLLICSKCAAKVHKECLNCPVNFDENGNFHCPMCLYDRITMEYHDSKKLMNCGKRRLMKFLPLLYRASKRLR